MARAHGLVTAVVPVQSTVMPGVLPVTIDDAVIVATEANCGSVLTDFDGYLRVDWCSHKRREPHG